MSLTNIGPTWSWQFLPQPCGMKPIRTAGRCLKRWGTVHGFKPGTSDAEKTRVLAARFIHVNTDPHTKSIPHFSSDEGFENPQVNVFQPAAKIGQPFTIPMLVPLFGLALKGLVNPSFSDGSPLHPDCSALQKFILAKEFPSGTLDWVLPLFRAFATVTNSFDPDDEAKADYVAAIEYWGWNRAVMLPLVADAPWKIASMPGGSTLDQADWNASPWSTQFMVA